MAQRSLTDPGDDTGRLAALWDAHRADPTVESRAALIEWYLPLLYRTAATIRIAPHVDRRDLIQDGVFGLARAIDRYQPDRVAAYSFDVLAWFYMRGAMVDAARAYRWGRRVTRDMTRQVEAATDNLRDELGRAPTAKEIAGRLGWPEHRVATMWRRMIPLDWETDTGRHPFHETFADPNAVPVDAAVIAADMARYLAAVEARYLSVHTRQVLNLYYRDRMVLKDVGARFGVTESRACQIVNGAARRLRDQVGQHL